MTKWRIKLPLSVSVTFVTLSLPFLLGFLTPSIHEGFYSALYVVVNLPGLFIVAGVSEWALRFFGARRDLHLSNLTTVVSLLVFWVPVFFITGSLMDAMSAKK